MRVNGLSVGLPGIARPLLLDISFELTPGERLALIGRSGSGKSVLASALLGMLRPPLAITSGRVELDGTTFCLFQNPAGSLSPCLRLLHQVERAAQDRNSAREALDAVGLAQAARKYPFELSGGMRQRALIAIAMVLKPRVLIADEPTTGLDPETQRDILTCLDELVRASGGSLLFISHDARAASALCSEAALLDQGRLVAKGPWNKLGSINETAAEYLSAVRRLEL